MSSSKCVKQPRKAYTKEQHEMTHSEKLRLIDDELNSFYKYCQQAGFTEEEMDIICQPLVAAMRRSWLQLVFRGTLVLIVLGTLACLAAQLDFVGTHFTALSRLLLIKVLPIWNWQPLYYENCMINNPFYNDYTITEEDCVTCEALETIDRLSDVRYRNLVDNYLNRDAPAIITDAMDSWAVMNTDYFWFDNITHLYLENERLMETVPCALTSNLRTGSSDLAAFLRRVHAPEVAKWFVHWQNCDINAVKVLRKYYQRPYFLSSTVSPAHFNWVLMSSDYNSPSYKKVELDSGLIALAQLRGATQLRLTPINPCNSSCPELIADLHQGEMLVFTNVMWTLEYAPMRGLDNIAILTETVWEEDT
ncbi:PREDICTED: uncharacterized protein LOC108783363 [Cyphomyrmex costatus]|uniref:uncharacterized protein LOC105453491 n=1 Tax=Wasmannia auropunctata TaxID=64793 RepID=UPI0005F08596|nr:PREDICTED: uncharacterized protein LOC105453491 [Wasmannia auropunctata]XP_018407412.1 PREDICTED: uncharacterized protein LOC108783363 [Cyphomyrmex costatus]